MEMDWKKEETREKALKNVIISFYYLIEAGIFLNFKIDLFDLLLFSLFFIFHKQ